MIPHSGQTELIVAVVGALDITAQNRQRNILLKRETINSSYLAMHLHATALTRTFAGLHALKPSVTSVSTASTSTVLEPSTARSAATDSAGFKECAAL